MGIIATKSFEVRFRIDKKVVQNLWCSDVLRPEMHVNFEVVYHTLITNAPDKFYHDIQLVLLPTTRRQKIKIFPGCKAERLDIR